MNVGFSIFSPPTCAWLNRCRWTTRPTGSAVVARHPGLSSPSRSRDVATPAGLASAVSRSIADLDWPEIRRWAMRGSLHPFVERDLARWMDEGMLARWIFAEMPPLHVLVDEAAQRLTPDAAAKLRDTVDLLVLRAEGDAA